MLDRVRGSLLGVALGDALGAPVEKLSHEEIKRLYGKVDDLEVPHYRTQSKIYGKGYGRITDDTLMTIKLCEIYEEKLDHLDAYDVFSLVKKLHFEDTWIPEFQRSMPLIERLFYPEKYIFLSNYLANRDPRSGGVGNMVNCGAAMYITPVGLVNSCDPLGAYKEAIAFASAHQQSYGLEAAGVFAAAVAAAMIPNITINEIMEIVLSLAKDGTREAIGEVVEAAKKMDPSHDNAEEFYRIINKYSGAGDNLIRDPEKVGTPSESYTPSRLKSIEELPVALGYIVLHDGNFMKALIDGVNFGRDSDSIGVMIGAILGAKNGLMAIPKKFVEKLEKANNYDFIQIADTFYKCIEVIQKNDLKRLNNIFKMREELRME